MPFNEVIFLTQYKQKTESGTERKLLICSSGLTGIYCPAESEITNQTCVALQYPDETLKAVLGEVFPGKFDAINPYNFTHTVKISDSIAGRDLCDRIYCELIRVDKDKYAEYSDITIRFFPEFAGCEWTPIADEA